MSMPGPSPNASQGAQVPNYTVLKIIVVVLGILLVFGFFALIAAMVYKASHMASSPRTSDLGISAADGNGQTREIVISVPAGARIADSRLEEGKLVSRLVFNDASGGPREEIWVIDPVSGKVEIRLRFEPK